MAVNIRLTDFETPDLDELKEFFGAEDDIIKLLDLGKHEWTVEVLGYVFKFGTLWEWEWREIYRKLSGLDIVAKEKLLKVEVLTKAIIELITPSNKKYTFVKEEEKVALRHLLLSLSPRVIDDLYAAFNYGEEIALKKFKSEVKELERRVKVNFFVSYGN